MVRSWMSSRMRRPTSVRSVMMSRRSRVRAVEKVMARLGVGSSELSMSSGPGALEKGGGALQMEKGGRKPYLGALVEMSLR